MATLVKVVLFLVCAIACATLAKPVSSRIKESAWFARHVTLSFVSITYTTAALNDALVRWKDKASPWQLSAFRLWFSMGAIYGVIAMFAAVLLLVSNAYFQFTILRHEWLNMGTPPTQIPKIDLDEPILTPVLPGINLPCSHAVYFVLALALNAVVHELGHAVAAMCDSVRINSFGIFLFFLYPGAFCDLKTEDLQPLSPWQKLRIFSAGVFHNITLAGLAFFCLRVALPFSLLSAYQTGVGAVVVDIHPNSAIYRHLPIGSRIVSINGMSQIKTSNDWYNVIRLDTEASFDKDHSSKRTGYCSNVRLPKEDDSPSSIADSGTGNTCMQRPVQVSLNSNSLIHVDLKIPPCPPESLQTAHSTVDCCQGIPQGSGGANFCFLYHTIFTQKTRPRQVCLPARKTVDSVACTVDDDCVKTERGKYGDGDSVCLFPSLDRGETLLKIELGSDPGSSPSFVLYTGDPRILGAAVYATDHSPRHWIFGLKMPQRLETMLRYMVALSLALSFLNIVPSLRLDGQYALWAVLDIFGQGEWAPLLIFFGTIVIGINVLFAFIILLVR